MLLSLGVFGTKLSMKQEIRVSKMLKDHFQLNQFGLNYDNSKDFLRPLVSIPLQFSSQNSDDDLLHKGGSCTAEVEFEFPT